MNDFLKVIVFGSLFAVPFLTLYVADGYFFPFITGKNFAFRILVEIGFVAWVVLALSEVKYRPKFSWLMSGFFALVVVMFFANLLGKHPPSSFWSNFERMDGYITLVHVFLYVLVLGSVLATKKLWDYFLHTTLFVASIVSLYGISQYLDPDYGKGRIDSYLGNAAYLAIYMLFHTFIAFWLFVESKVNWQRVIYGILAVMFVFTLFETGTRGTALGLVVGFGVMMAYIAVFGAKYQEFRRVAIGMFILMVAGVGVFIAVKDSDYIQNNTSLARIANINLAEDLQVRGTIWGMAWEGVKDRPLLGWGQSNFNYVFNEQYDPFLYDQEQWFDRSHNIVMDWLVTGGFLGLIAYLSIFVACLYYLFVLPLLKKGDETFTVLERAVLLGILVGYFTHNLVVFDNIISYIFFAIILALIHSRVAKPIARVEGFKIDKSLIKQFVAPVAVVFVIAIIYTLHIPGMKAAGDLIDGLTATDPASRLEAFERALDRDSFAQQEIAEQLAQQTMEIMRNSKVPEEIRLQYIVKTNEELGRLIERKPGDARVHVFVGSFYRTIGNFEEAEKQLAIARELSPLKQSIILQQGIVAYGQNEHEEARDFFGEAFRLDERNVDARAFYMGTLLLTGDSKSAVALAENQEIIDKIAFNDFLVNAVNQAGEKELLIELYKVRVDRNPEDEKGLVTLAFLYNEQGDKDKAIEILESIADIKPELTKALECFVSNIETGKDPQEGC